MRGILAIWGYLGHLGPHPGVPIYRLGGYYRHLGACGHDLVLLQARFSPYLGPHLGPI